MSANNRSKKLLKTILRANAGCGCGKPKPSDVFEPQPKPKPQLTLPPPPSNDAVSITTTTATTTTSATTGSSSPSTSRPSPKKRRLNDACIAVVKDSNDPLKDFKHSMKQMIVEKEIREKPELEELLACFLELNSASHREVIVRAFAEIWNEVVVQRRAGKGKELPRM